MKEVINYLILEKKVNINYTDKYGKTALHYAFVNTDFELIKLLLENDARMDIEDNNDNSPLYYGFNFSNDILSLYNCIEKPGHFTPKDIFEEICYTLPHIDKKQQERLLNFIKTMIRTNKIDINHLYHGSTYTALLYATEDDLFQIVTCIMAYINKDTANSVSEGHTALSYAALHKHKDIFEFLYRHEKIDNTAGKYTDLIESYHNEIHRKNKKCIKPKRTKTAKKQSNGNKIDTNHAQDGYNNFYPINTSGTKAPSAYQFLQNKGITAKEVKKMNAIEQSNKTQCNDDKNTSSDTQKQSVYTWANTLDTTQKPVKQVANQTNSHCWINDSLLAKLQKNNQNKYANTDHPSIIGKQGGVGIKSLKNTFKAYPFTISLGDKQYKNCIFSHEYKFNGAGKAGKERIALTQLPCDDNTNELSKSMMFVGFDYLPKGIHTNAAKKSIQR